MRVAVGRLVSLNVPWEDIPMRVLAAEQNLPKCGASLLELTFHTKEESLLMEQPDMALQEVMGLPLSHGWG